MNESKIIASVLGGDREAYAEIIKKYHIGLIIHCERLVKDRDDAEDIAQEAFIKAYNSLAKYNQAICKFSTWLYKIATNTAIDFLRKNKRKFNVEDIELLADQTEPVELEKDDKLAIRSAVAALVPPEFRLAIEAYFWRGLSYAQIAKEMDKPVSTIGTYIRRGKQKLKGELSWLG